MIDISEIHHQHDAESRELLQLRKVLPPEAFHRTPWRIVVMATHALLIFGVFRLAAVHFGFWAGLTGAVVVGHSLACLGFLAHDLSHGNMLRRGTLRHAAETFFWGMAMVSRTVWRRTHNHTHHAHYATMEDPDRRFADSERGPATTLYNLLMYPGRKGRLGLALPMLLLQPVYNAQNLIAAFMPGKSKPVFLPAKPVFKGRDRLLILLEIAVIAGIQYALFAFTGFDRKTYLCLSLGGLLIGSNLAIFYIATNHLLNGIHAGPDLLKGCTSVIVPRWIDVLHSYFSYHTEHHLFPSLNPAYYPQVSALLAEKYPESYQRIPILTAWLRLWRLPLFDHAPKIGRETGKEMANGRKGA